MTFCLSCTLPLPDHTSKRPNAGDCICTDWQSLNLDQLDLSSHAILFQPLEKQKRSSSGRLISRLSNIQQATWHRLQNKAQAALFSDFKLVYPSSKEHPAQPAQPSDRLLLLDGTWQQSQKMLRKSPWLANLPRVSFTTPYTSQYRLRRNQQNKGVSTLEALALCLIEQGHSRAGKDLIVFLDLFQQAYFTSRQAGRFKTGTHS